MFSCNVFKILVAVATFGTLVVSDSIEVHHGKIQQPMKENDNETTKTLAIEFKEDDKGFQAAPFTNIKQYSGFPPPFPLYPFYQKYYGLLTSEDPSIQKPPQRPEQSELAYMLPEFFRFVENLMIIMSSSMQGETSMTGRPRPKGSSFHYGPGEIEMQYPLEDKLPLKSIESSDEVEHSKPHYQAWSYLPEINSVSNPEDQNSGPDDLSARTAQVKSLKYAKHLSRYCVFQGITPLKKNDCNKYLVCLPSRFNRFDAYIAQCPEDKKFSKIYHRCVQPYLVPECFDYPYSPQPKQPRPIYSNPNLEFDVEVFPPPSVKKTIAYEEPIYRPFHETLNLEDKPKNIVQENLEQFRYETETTSTVKTYESQTNESEKLQNLKSYTTQTSEIPVETYTTPTVSVTQEYQDVTSRIRQSTKNDQSTSDILPIGTSVPYVEKQNTSPTEFQKDGDSSQFRSQAETDSINVIDYPPSNESFSFSPGQANYEENSTSPNNKSTTSQEKTKLSYPEISTESTKKYVTKEGESQKYINPLITAKEPTDLPKQSKSTTTSKYYERTDDELETLQNETTTVPFQIATDFESMYPIPLSPDGEKITNQKEDEKYLEPHPLETTTYSSPLISTTENSNHINNVTVDTFKTTGYVPSSESYLSQDEEGLSEENHFRDTEIIPEHSTPITGRNSRDPFLNNKEVSHSTNENLPGQINTPESSGDHSTSSKGENNISTNANPINHLNTTTKSTDSELKFPDQSKYSASASSTTLENSPSDEDPFDFKKYQTYTSNHEASLKNNFGTDNEKITLEAASFMETHSPSNEKIAHKDLYNSGYPKESGHGPYSYDPDENISEVYEEYDMIDRDHSFDSVGGVITETPYSFPPADKENLPQ